VLSLLICLALARLLGNFKASGCLVGRPTCAPATTRLTPQVVGISTITYTPVPTVEFKLLGHVCHVQKFVMLVVPANAHDLLLVKKNHARVIWILLGKED